MNSLQKFTACLYLAVLILAARSAIAQAPVSPASKDQSPPAQGEPLSRVTIEVLGGEKDTPVENASVYVKYVEERKLQKNKKLELNIKTNREGIAHVPNAPFGKVLVQIVAEGWKPYGRWYEINDPKQTIKVHLQRPPKWY